MQLTREQQQQFSEQFNGELTRMTMSWDNELRQWYPTALRALEFASAISLNVPQEKVIDLFKQEIQGLNMNVVAALSNNLELRTAREMEVTAKDWAHFLVVNARVAQRWRELSEPVSKKIFKEFEAINNPRIIKMGQA